MEAILDRLAAHVRSAPGNERLIAGRVGGVLWLIAAVGTLVLPFLPQAHMDVYPWPIVIALAAAAWGLLGVFVINWRRVPDVLMTTGTVAGMSAAAVVTQMTGAVESPARTFCIFTLTYSSCFLPMRHAAALVLACAAVWALPVGIAHGTAAGISDFALTLPIYGVVGVVLLGGRLLLTSMRRSAEQLSEEHHALRALATAVASGQPPDVVCNHAAAQAARLLRADGAGIVRYDADDWMTLVGRSGEPGEPGDGKPQPGTRFPLAPDSELAAMRAHGHAMRVDDYGDRTDEQALRVAEFGYRAWAGTPVHVRGRLWGAIVVTGVEPHSLPDNTEEHLSEFAELVGMAVANTEEVARLNADATTDPLTGLANHRAFQERLRAELARAQRHGQRLAVAVLDIDRFKEINDAGGHAVGDEVLRSVTALLGEHLRPYDVLARLGGDELAILLPGCDGAEAAGVLERARQRIERAPFSRGARVTISVGVCDIDHAAEAEDLVRYADGALYWSKEHGRNRVSTYDPERIHELSAAERLDQLQRSQALVGIRALARAIDARDPSTREHSERVAELAARLAVERGWPADRVALLHEAALVHDVGKIGIPDAILLKPSRLTREEYEVIKGHAELGARIVEDVLTPEQVEWIHSHHERPDGEGYPRGLRGDQLSEGAGLLAAADAFDVMVSKRPYSPSRDLDDALREVAQLTGRQFTPEAVAALEGVYGAADVRDLAA
jgi:diguanylate cyclase (GGDEF)-like protein/putative nucleotidyltransferase with HDIG domain